MVKSFIRESIELETVTLDSTGFGVVTKKINLKEGYRHNMMQVDLFQDSIPLNGGSSQIGLVMEVGVSPYPIIPTEMNVKSTGTALGNRMPAAANDTMLFKAVSTVRDNDYSQLFQFPSAQISAEPSFGWYSNEIYVVLYLHGEADQDVTGICLSFYLALDNKKVDSLEAGIGILREKHEAHCMELMSNGHMTSKPDLQGNVFPMWRYGGIRPEHMLSAVGTGGFFLPISTKDEETMESISAVRSMVAQSRSMSAFDQAFGDTVDDIPDWLRFNLVQGLVSGAVREQWPPNKYHDNGNVMML
jgi:hypothetical protein